jgi:pyruvate kinase
MTASNQLAGRAESALGELLSLRADVAHEGLAAYRLWRGRIERPGFASSALNLAHYLAVRRRDLRPLQRKLMSLGVSSLGRLEGRVLASLDAVAVALSSLADVEASVTPPSDRQFFRGETGLQINATESLGPPALGRSGRIMVTLPGEAADDPQFIADLVRRGTEVVRINCAHDGPKQWTKMVDHARAARSSAGAAPRVLMDLAGPKVRTGRVVTPPDRNRVFVGDVILLTREVQPPLPETPFQMTCTAPEVLDRLTPGAAVSIDDGALHGVVLSSTPGGFQVRVARGKLGGVKLRPEKGLNFPNIDLGLDPITDKDRDDLDFIVRHADLIGYSFVQTAGHVAALQAELARRTGDWRRFPLIGKIETPLAVRNLPDIIVEAAGRQPFAVMIARGDLAVEMGFERVAELQEEIMWVCEAAHVPVIWATQVLEDLVKEGLPSRGEMTDAAMAARAECVMLNKGPNVGGAVEVLDRLLRRMAEHQVKKTPTLRALHAWERPDAAPGTQPEVARA